MKTWTKPFVHRNHFYEAMFVKNTLLDRVEVCVTVHGKRVKLVEPDVSEKAMIEKLKIEIDRALHH